MIWGERSVEEGREFRQTLRASTPVRKSPAVLKVGSYAIEDAKRRPRFSTNLSTYSDGNKAMGSKPRTIFGEFIKGGLESAGVLRRGEPITDEVLEAYGRDSVTLTKLTNGEYVVTF